MTPISPRVVKARPASRGDRAAVPALVAALQKERAEADVRREAALALGAIGDAAALPALRAALTATDPYLSQAAENALKKFSQAPGI